MLTVICGGMFSEKSTELLRRGRRLKRAGRKIIFIKPDFDSRYSDDDVVTHDGVSEKAINLNVNSPEEFFDIENIDSYDVYLFDELQFYSEEIVFLIYDILSNDKDVIVAGLDMDYLANPFKVMGHLMAHAENVVKLQSVCTQCGGNSWVTYKEDNGKRIELGNDIYKPMCRKCYHKNTRD